MPVESKPLFHPEVIRQRLLHFGLPLAVEESRQRLRHWADLIASGRADALKETDLLPDFLTELDSDAFVAEVKNIRGRKLPLTAAALQALRQEHANTIEPARHRAAEALALEHQINHLINQAYALKCVDRHHQSGPCEPNRHSRSFPRLAE